MTSEGARAHADSMLAALAAVIPGRSAIYVSAPITTGPRYIDWRNRSCRELAPASRAIEFKSEVIEPNLRSAAEVVKRVRLAFPEVPVVDPTALENLPGWDQHHYHEFWVDVLERFVHTVVFVNGWHLSTGCVTEFVKGLADGLILWDENLHPLDWNSVQVLLEQALTMAPQGVPRVEPVLRALELVHDLKGRQVPVSSG